jgi:hypothetical protein
MHPRASRLRVATALGSGLLLLAITAGGTAAAKPAELFVIDIDLDTGIETFVADHPLLCESGDSFTNFEFAAGFRGAAGTFHLTKELVCDDGSGSFVIRVDAAANFVVGVGTLGGWSVVPGSGTGDYVGLRGGGSVVGLNTNTEGVDLIDHYYGTLRQ